ncbi:MAG: hypothetical protein JO349_09860 [Candidatus Eremiobacteraeota bacterium]|nr:hypothetical protein [Candidatus Eremiobacteraeota bacterium]
MGPRLVTRRVAAAALFALFSLATGRVASAEPTLIDASSQPIVLIQHTQPITIQTWERPQIAVDAGGEQPLVQRRPNRMPGTTPTTPYSVPIPAISVPSPDGTPVTLAAEEFPVQIPAGPHDTIRIQVPQNQATVMIPADTTVLSINGVGGTRIQNYHGQLIAQQRAGPLVLQNVSGDAFVQNLRGQIFVVDSNFDRLRTRTALNNMVFQRCNVRQIDATSDRGSILYNNGSFQSGLARFETVSGHVALGVNGGANVAVKGQPGQIYENFDRPTQFRQGNGEANAMIGGGGPLVNVVTQQGRVYLYDGSLANKQRLPPHWQQIRQNLQAERQREQQQPPFPAFRR